MLREKPNFPFRLLITSRSMHDIQRLRRSLESSAVMTSMEIPVQDTIHDIECYIQTRIHDLLVNIPTNRERLKRRILSKSNASFLWARLVLDELENVYSAENITVLEKIPEGMIPFYERIAKGRAANTLEKHIVKEVLAWTTICARKLTIPELSQALETGGGGLEYIRYY